MSADGRYLVAVTDGNCVFIWEGSDE